MRYKLEEDGLRVVCRTCQRSLPYDTNPGDKCAACGEKALFSPLELRTERRKLEHHGAKS